MDYLIEAKKFIQHARQTDVPEIANTDLELAEWLLSDSRQLAHKSN